MDDKTNNVPLLRDALWPHIETLANLQFIMKSHLPNDATARHLLGMEADALAAIVRLVSEESTDRSC